MTAPTRVPGHPGVDPSCPICLGESYQVAAAGEHARARLCACVSTCRQCGGVGFVAADDGRHRRCVCARFEDRLRRLDAVRIPGRMAGATLQSFRPSKAVMPAFQASFKFTKHFDRTQTNRGLVLWGEVGRGKTHLMIAILRELVVQHGITARFVEFSHLLADIKSGFDRGVGASSTLDPLVSCDVLAIDELGKGRNTEFEGTVVDELISRRYNAARTVLATSNYAPGPSSGRATANLADPAARPALVDRVGDRVYSRLREMVDFVKVDGADYRETQWAERP